MGSDGPHPRMLSVLAAPSIRPMSPLKALGEEGRSPEARRRQILHLALKTQPGEHKPVSLTLVPGTCPAQHLYQWHHQCTLIKFTDDTKLSGPGSTLKGRSAIQRDLGRLEEWAIRHLLKSNKDKCHVLHLGRMNPLQQHNWSWAGLELVLAAMVAKTN